MADPFHITLAGWDIVLTQDDDGAFAVRYGAGTQRHLHYDDACTALGAAILHALACEGRITNDDDE